MRIPQLLQTFLNYMEKGIDWLGIMVKIEDIPEEKRKVIAEIDTPTLELMLLQRQSKEEVPTDIEFNRALTAFTLITLILIFLPYVFGSKAFLILFLLLAVPAFLGFGYHFIPFYYGKKDRTIKHLFIFSIYFILIFSIVWIELSNFFPQLNEKIEQFNVILLATGISSLMGYGISMLIAEYTVGMNIINAGNFSISALSNDYIVENYREVIMNTVSNGLSNRSAFFQSAFYKVFRSDDKKGEIYRIGRIGRLLVYFNEATISFCVFKQNGKYLLQDDVTRELQDKIGFILKNNMNFSIIGNMDSINEGKINSILRQYIKPSAQFLHDYKRPIAQFAIIGVLVGSILGLLVMFPNKPYTNVLLGAIGAALGLMLYAVARKYFE